jgi:multidrug resistance efflux pump
LLVKVRPDSYKALLEQQEAAISSAKATNLQQKATMMKTEQDLKRADDMYSKKTISIQGVQHRAGPLTTWQKILSKARSMRSNEHRPVSSRARDQLSKTTIYSPNRWHGNDLKQQTRRAHRGATISSPARK